MPSKIQSIRGMNDILPVENGDIANSFQWQYLERVFANILEQYAYKEIRTPALEKSELFHRGVGEVTDIVEKETYDFKDRNNESLTLRPEGTAGCVRAVIEHNMLRGQKQKLWYKGPMYRHERPQKGRYRQFYQLGVEALGFDDEAVELETLFMTWRFWQNLGLSESVILEINNLGSNQSREAYKLELVKYFEKHKASLDEDSQRRLHKNPLRILDSKNEQMRSIIDGAPKFKDYVDEKSQHRFNVLCQQLDLANIPYKINPYLVRGIDYYTHTVFEWITTNLGAQGTICAGGRYDNLIKTLGGADTPAFGFALGFERILILLKQQKLFPDLKQAPFLYFIHSNKEAQYLSLKLAEDLRRLDQNISAEVNLSGGSFKSQFKQADKSNASFAIIIGEDELQHSLVLIKPLTEKAKIIIANEIIRNNKSKQSLEDKTPQLVKDQLVIPIRYLNNLIKKLFTSPPTLKSKR
ncbi:histidine--tRNA ligase [Thiotrichales bacterium 19S9-12]|nr:histidine--tRNA ligase [Thiotrichales bacterium 19S9-11]MCF6811654.1 histidine--tRNA ligase [Thiotrichales bacterium 19S9-12]